MQYKRGMRVLILLEVIALVIISSAALLRLTKKVVENKRIEKVTATEETEDLATASDEQLATEGDAQEVQGSDSDVEEDFFSQEILDKVDSMSTEDKVAQLFAVTPEIITDESQVTYAGEEIGYAMERYPVASFVFSDWNYEYEEQMIELLRGTQNIGEEVSGDKLLVLACDDRGEDDKLFYQIGAVDALAKAMGSEEGFAGTVGVNQITDDVADVTEDTSCMILRDVVDATFIAALRQQKSYNYVIITEIEEKEIDGDYYETSEYAVYAIKNGVDMLYAKQSFEASYVAVLSAVENGDIDMDTIDNAVARVLTFKNMVN